MSAALVAATLERLRQHLPDLAVELYPGRPQDYRLNHPVGAVLLSYPGASGQVVSMLGGVRQKLDRAIGLTLVARHLWGDSGAVALLDRARATLLGWTPPHHDPCWLRRESLQGERDGLWYYSQEFVAASQVCAGLSA